MNTSTGEEVEGKLEMERLLPERFRGRGEASSSSGGSSQGEGGEGAVGGRGGGGFGFSVRMEGVEPPFVVRLLKAVRLPFEDSDLRLGASEFLRLALGFFFPAALSVKSDPFV